MNLLLRSILNQILQYVFHHSGWILSRSIRTDLPHLQLTSQEHRDHLTCPRRAIIELSVFLAPKMRLYHTFGALNLCLTSISAVSPGQLLVGTPLLIPAKTQRLDSDTIEVVLEGRWNTTWTSI